MLFYIVCVCVCFATWVAAFVCHAFLCFINMCYELSLCCVCYDVFCFGMAFFLCGVRALLWFACSLWVHCLSVYVLRACCVRF